MPWRHPAAPTLPCPAGGSEPAPGVTAVSHGAEPLPRHHGGAECQSCRECPDVTSEMQSGMKAGEGREGNYDLKA